MDKFVYAQKGTSAPFSLAGQNAMFPKKKQNKEKRKTHIYSVAHPPEQKDREKKQRPFGQFAANAFKPMRWNPPEPQDIPEEKTMVSSINAPAPSAAYDETERQEKSQIVADADPSKQAEAVAQDAGGQTPEADEEALEQCSAPAVEPEYIFKTPAPHAPVDEQEASLSHDTVESTDSSEDRGFEASRSPTVTVEEESLCAKGLLAYKQLWYRENVDISVNGKMLSGIPIFLEQSALRMVNESYSYIIPLDRVDYIRTYDGYKSACDQLHWKFMT